MILASAKICYEVRVALQLVAPLTSLSKLIHYSTEASRCHRRGAFLLDVINNESIYSRRSDSLDGDSKR